MRVLVSTFTLCLALPATAQSLPTDADLRTAYCIRVATSHLAQMQQMMGGEPQGSPAYAFVQKTLKEQSDLVNRLQSHLLPKLSTLDATPLLVAAKRADSDLEEADAAARACTARCAPQLENGRPGQKWSACTDDCLAGPLQVRLRACRTPDWLPF